MPNRYDDERGWGGRGESAGYRGSERRFNRYEDEYDQPGERYSGGERYFGSGRQSFGEGYTEGYGDFGSYPPSYGSGSSRFGRETGERPSRRRRGGASYRGQSRSTTGPYGGEYGGGTSRGSASPYGRSQSRSQSRRGVYGGSYPESERGYITDPESYESEERGWWDRTSDEVASWFGDDEAARRREMDERQSHRGRGPRGYTRSDERIKEDINDDLTDSWVLDASNIEVEVTSGDVVLTGTVDSRYEKRLAEDIAEDVSGVKNVENRIRVNTDYGRTYGEDTAASRTTTGTTGTTGSTGTTKSRTVGGTS